MSSNQVMAQGLMDSGYGGCLLMHRAYFLWLQVNFSPRKHEAAGGLESIGSV